MRIRAGAPGKLVVLGEYAVLAGAEALVLAVDRRCEVSLERTDAAAREIDVRAPKSRIFTFEAGASSGLGLIDAVLDGRAKIAAGPGFRGVVDSRRFFADSGRKLGIGSSAAVLVAFAGAIQAIENKDIKDLTLDGLIELHRCVQGGSGSGIDVAAALLGGLRTFRLDRNGAAEVGSVQLPNSVGFAGIFAGQSAKTSDFVGRFNDWRYREPNRAAPLLAELAAVSAGGCDALRAGDAEGFLAAIGAYGVLLESLGIALGCDVLTREHRQIGLLAQRFDVRYKTSGAGGGDLGIAFSQDAAALAALRNAVTAEGFLWVDFGVDAHGLRVEELSE